MSDVVFVSSGVLSATATDELLNRLREAMPDRQFEMLPPGVALSNPFDVAALCDSINSLVQVSQQLLAANQGMLAEILEMHADDDERVNPEHHLGMGTLGG